MIKLHFFDIYKSRSVEFNLSFVRFVKISRISISLEKDSQNDFRRKIFAPRGTRVVVSLTTKEVITHSILAKARGYKNTRPNCTVPPKWNYTAFRGNCKWKVLKLYCTLHLTEVKNRCVINKIIIHRRMNKLNPESTQGN